MKHEMSAFDALKSDPVEFEFREGDLALLGKQTLRKVESLLATKNIAIADTLWGKDFPDTLQKRGVYAVLKIADTYEAFDENSWPELLRELEPLLQSPFSVTLETHGSQVQLFIGISRKKLH